MWRNSILRLPDSSGNWIIEIFQYHTFDTYHKLPIRWKQSCPVSFDWSVLLAETKLHSEPIKLVIRTICEKQSQQAASF